MRTRNAFSLATMTLVGVLVACGGSGGSYAPLATDAEFSQPKRITILGYAGDTMEPFISPNNSILFFNNRNDPTADTNLYYAERVDDLTFQFKGEIGDANSTSLDAVASIDISGMFYFISTQSFATTASTVYRGIWSAGTLSSFDLVSGIPASAPGHVIFDAGISPDGNTLCLSEGDYSSGSLTTSNIVLAEKTTAGFTRSPQSATTLQRVNLAGGTQYAAALSASGLEIFFTRIQNGTPAIFTASRTSTTSPFGPENIIKGITGFVEAPSISLDGKALYFHSLVNGQYVIYRATRP